ncbi:hypothetical protein ALC56_07254 [Trachymyrmex septentrionalis]|uniref:Uncharacterized protein n=1 Tax=Trachymyrmex septentrionalis TaxID=34720 RepID=A0A195FDW2_9HYME|nr:hypothetical protein ALC56_07254 [Trachymyrmex septentrionalis]
MLGQNNVCGIREEKTIFKETMPGATRILAPSHGKVLTNYFDEIVIVVVSAVAMSIPRRK